MLGRNSSNIWLSASFCQDEGSAFSSEAGTDDSVAGTTLFIIRPDTCLKYTWMRGTEAGTAATNPNDP